MIAGLIFIRVLDVKRGKARLSQSLGRHSFEAHSLQMQVNMKQQKM